MATGNAEGKPQARRRLARDFVSLGAFSEPSPYFDVVVVGSGYGGSVAAHALAGATVADDQAAGKRRKLTVCVLERGREYLPGEFPARFEDLPAHLRHADQSTGSVGGNLEGLFDVRMGEDVYALVANGLGGGSLINAGVLLKPASSDFDVDTPARDLVDSLRAAGWYDKALRLLGGKLRRGDTSIDNTIARHAGAPLAKTFALESLAPTQTFARPPITVAMELGPNSAGVTLPACTLCGDCMTGCNVGAKDSLDANLLDVAAESENVTLYTGASVLALRRDAAGWAVSVVHTAAPLQARELGAGTVRAGRVILAAGTLGSTEILLRSRSDKLAFSPRLGEGFSCNGDNLAAVTSMRTETRAAADEDVPEEQRRVGPTITGSIGLEVAVPTSEGGTKTRSFQLQEFSVPGPMKHVFAEIVTTARALHTLPEGDPTRHGGEDVDAIDPLAVDEQVMKRTMLVGMIGHDEAEGVLYLSRPLARRRRPPVPGAIAIRWPQARRGALLEAAHARVVELVQRQRDPFGRHVDDVGAPQLVANPMWRLLPPDLALLVSQPVGPVLTVHPLGGCRIGPATGPDSRAGVVDELGRVYDFTSPSREPFDTLVVLDGSIIPGSLGVNPSLTIAAVALRAMETLTEGWQCMGPHTAGETTTRAERDRRRLTPPKVPLDEHSLPSSGSTEVQIVERLRGELPLSFGAAGPRPCVVEITAAYEPVTIHSLVTRLQRSMRVVTNDESTRLRVYDGDEWRARQLDLESDIVRQRFAMLEATLAGTLSVLSREPSTPSERSWRGAWAWFRNRGTRDIFQRKDDPGSTAMDFVSYARSLWKLASRAGEVRRLDYELQIVEILPNIGRLCTADATGLAIQRCDIIRGSKRLTYGRRANPWRQLTEMTLDEMPGASRPGVLRLDGAFLAGQGFPLLRITKQRNHAVALRELFSFALYMTRVLISVHLWTFRKPDARRSDDPVRGRTPVRLPQAVAGLVEPQVYEIVVDRMPHTDVPVTVRLTRFERPLHAPPGARQPLVMIHGYSASGNTYTHASLAPSAARHFCDAGYDVWVVDLRTSAALATATYPWAMEQAGLIDIPHALMHVRAVTGQRVDVLAHCIGCVMLSMAILTDAGEIASDQVHLGIDTWLTREQLGMLQAFNGSPRAGDPHPCLRRVVLSQKGPVLRYTDNNVFRAFVLQFARRWLIGDDYQFRASAEPKVAEQLLDRFLSSIPYPDADYDVENPHWPCKRTPWVSTRHRMDALYGRAFSALNMLPDTLDAIDDVFGPINMETISQTIHFARVGAITNQAGRGEFVTLGRLRERWGGIETLVLHGKNNGLVDVRTQDLLRTHLKAAGVPLAERDPDDEPYRSLGHQDVLMGRQSRLVFEDIARFLAVGVEPSSLPAAMPLIVDVPWSGPRFDPPDPDVGGATSIAILSKPTLGRGQLYLVPVARHGDADGDHGYVVWHAPDAVAASGLGSNDDWMRAVPPIAALQAAATRRASHAPHAQPGWLALAVFEADETTARITAIDLDPGLTAPHDATRDVPAPDSRTPLAAPPGLHARSPVPAVPDHLFNQPVRLDLDSAFFRASREATIEKFPAIADIEHGTQIIVLVQRWLERQRTKDLDLAFVRLDDAARAQRHAPSTDPASRRQTIAFAFGSCQYVAGLTDRSVSQETLLALARAAGVRKDAGPPLDVVLFLGDQIYADATAGLVDPTRRDERYDHPNDDALRGKGMRAVLRRVPARMLLDDHELRDNWEPLPERVAAQRRDDKRETERALDFGVGAWAKYQRMRPLAPKASRVGAGDLAFDVGGHPFRFLDTRTGRSARGSLVAQADILASDGQVTRWNDLCAWLRTHKDAVKFVATPSILLPRRRVTHELTGGSQRSDAWDGFPASLERLLGFLYDEQITRTVFLSGDEHYPLFTQCIVTRKGGTKPGVTVLSIHSSALYAPFPFANGRPEQIADETDFDLGTVHVDLETTFAPPGNGFVRVVVPGDPCRQLDVEWVDTEGRTRLTWARTP